MLKLFNVIGIIIQLLLLRKLVWCLRWLWCWKHDRETPPPIGWLPSRDGGRFDAHVRKRDGEDASGLMLAEENGEILEKRKETEEGE